jgi:15-cis-phytoene desaturase
MSSHSKHAVVIGGGVAGLTAAHELLERGFNVTLCEQRRLLGGKSRSYEAMPLDKNGSPIEEYSVPAEHGFRFFAGFYRHLDDTMRRIPLDDAGGKSVIDCLIPIKEELLAVPGKPLIHFSAAAKTVRDVRNLLRFPKMLADVGLTEQDLQIFSGKLWQIATSCDERSNKEYELIGWRQFVESPDRSDEYYWYLASGLTRVLVAARARRASTKTMGNVALKLLSSLGHGSHTMDRVLNGPTNEVWINPWINHLHRIAQKRRTQFRLELNCTVRSVHIVNDLVEFIECVPTDLRDSITPARPPERIAGDFFVFALSLNAMAGLIDQNNEFRAHGNRAFSVDGLRHRNQFSNIVDLASPAGKHLQWMSGLQIYLAKDERLNRGHQLYLDSAWGLTSISQAQFWGDERNYLPKGIAGVLSVDVSSWDVSGLNKKNAKECTKQELFQEVTAEIRAALPAGALADENIVGWHLDDSIVELDLADHRNKLATAATINLEPILVNDANSWHLRPISRTPIKNAFLAGDYTQTTTDLACMEGANESARRAVNAILESCGDWGLCSIFSDSQFSFLAPLREVDSYRFERGLPWSGPDLGKWILGAGEVARSLGDISFGAPTAHGSVSPPVRPQALPTSAETALPYHLPRTEWDDSGPQVNGVVALTRDQVVAQLDNKFATPGRVDPLFKRWRLFQLASSPQRPLIPFHAYQADALVIHGKAHNFDRLESATRGTPFRPVYAKIKGRRVGFAELWVIDYADTVCGPYKEIVINFVVRRDEEREYHWRSPYSSIVPMNDTGNRLFSLKLLLDAVITDDRGPIAYGRKLFGFDKEAANISIGRRDGFKVFQCEQDGQGVLEGKIDEEEALFQTLADTSELARELGAIEFAKSVKQIRNGEELAGGLVTKDVRKAGSFVEVLAAYKYAPKISLFESGNSSGFRYKRDSSFGRLLKEIDFEHTIATRDATLKTVLYVAGWPTPEDG